MSPGVQTRNFRLPNQRLHELGLLTSDAREDLVSLKAFIAEDKPGAARVVAGHILDVVQNYLATSPSLGYPGRIAGTRELVIAKTHYIVAYDVRGGVINILRVYSSFQRWPDRFDTA